VLIGILAVLLAAVMKTSDPNLIMLVMGSVALELGPAVEAFSYPTGLADVLSTERVCAALVE